MGSAKATLPAIHSTTTFETFPFPWSPGHEDTSHPAHAAISAAAAQLHEERHAWLNPDTAQASKSPPKALGGDLEGGKLKDRTLTNLYNALQVFRGNDSMKTKPAAADFAPRLDQLHQTLDHAVCDAYGWPHDILNDEEEILRRLLALNLERASAASLGVLSVLGGSRFVPFSKDLCALCASVVKNEIRDHTVATPTPNPATLKP